jgi:alpha-D-xyloside xylohydrolase
MILRSRPGILAPALAFALLPLAAPTAGAATPERLDDGIIVPVESGLLRIELCAADVVHVAFAPTREFLERRSLVAGGRRCNVPPFELETHGGDAVLKMAELAVKVDLGNGRVSFLDKDGKPVLEERKGGRELVPATVEGEATTHVRQVWDPVPDEGLYGLGQMQLGLMKIGGYDLDLWQHNVSAVVPMLVSSAGYGILWDNTSYTRFGDLRPFELIPADQLVDEAGQKGALSGSYYAGDDFSRHVAARRDPAIDFSVDATAKEPNHQIHPELPAEGPISVRWDGFLQTRTPGDHQIQTFSNGGIKVWIDGQLVIDHWRQGWLPWYDVARVFLSPERRTPIRIEWTKDQGMERMQLRWKTPDPPDAGTSLWSEVGDGVDYYFLYGPALDRVVAGYRRVSGEAPMMPRWAFGLWQSRERYKTSQEVLDVLEGFRSRGIPLDVIVQDWFYWKENAWGSHEFDPERFPDPAGWLRKIHDQWKARLMLSVWPKFYPGTQNFEALKKGGDVYESTLKAGFKDWVGPGYPYTFYDAFSADGRRIFWSQVARQLLPLGIDAWWMDATEPDLLPTPTLDGQREYMNPTAMGTGARMLNAYSLVNSQAVYEGQRAAAPDRRVFVLTRSAFAGQQRYASATWSGDVTSTWTAMRKQITAGLGMSISGIPYWTHDIGGFAVPGRFARDDMSPADAEEWAELNVRWFQFGVFTPLTRVHGQYPYREMWHFGGESSPAYAAELALDRLRYRMLPYTYSLAGGVTHDAGTIMRPLVMDFPEDARARTIGDQYMFGPAFLVSPVTTYQARSRPVYLPLGASWYDFWTGHSIPGGQTIDVDAPYERLPVHVRAGSIVPFGPELQRTDEKPADPITLYVYTGHDGAFSLYEDDGLTYAYEKGQLATIPIRWSEAQRVLTIGARAGAFPGMLAERDFDVVFVTKQSPAGFSFTPSPNRSVRYTGVAVEVKLDEAALTK